MHPKRLALLCLFVFAIKNACSLPTQLSYTVGQEFQYTLAGTLDAKGLNANTGSRTNGATSTLDSVMLTQCVQEDADSYLFVMNLFNTEVNVGQSLDAKQPVNFGDDNSLGEDMYYQQKKTGEIVQVWYESDDSMYFVNVKLGAINALQTHIVGVNQQATVLESDPVGSHYSSYVGDGSAMLVLNKTFSEADFQSFPDQNLKPQNVRITALTSTAVHADGYIYSSYVSQMVDLVNVGTPSSVKEPRTQKIQDGSDTTPLDVYMSSFGTLSISMGNSKPVLRNQQTTHFPDILTLEQLEKSTTYNGKSMFDIAKKSNKHTRRTLPAIDIQQAVKTILIPSSSSDAKLMKKIVRYFNARPEELIMFQEFLERVNKAQRFGNAEATVVNRVFYILSQVVRKEGQAMLVKFGLKSKQISMKSLAILAAANVRHPKGHLLKELANIASNNIVQVEMRDSALLSFGSAMSKVRKEKSKKIGSEFLLKQLKQALSSSDNVNDIVTIVHALGNAGPSVIPGTVLTQSMLLKHSMNQVRVAAVQALRKHLEDDRVIQVIQDVMVNDPSVQVQKACIILLERLGFTRKALMDNILALNNDFPFNKNYSKEISVGGSVIAADFSGELFAGTNFDCNQKDFNYEADAEVKVDLTLFGVNQQAVYAQAIYGKDNGAPLADRIFLQAWDEVVYNQPIPQVDCNEHIYPLGHYTAPGLSVNYVLWVSVIPVIFSASADLELDLSWGWQVCDSQLSALVELIPKAAVSVDGQAEVDLLIIKAAIEISGSLNTQIRPQGYIDGANCTVGFDVREESDPMDAQIDSYYVWRHCKYWIFDCSWGEHHEQTWFSWDRPATNQVLVDEAWKIQA